MIPEFLYREDAPFGVLPPGIHEASIEEIEARFATNPIRKNLFRGILAVIEALKAAGCRQMYLDGSFVTSKDFPNDFDGCWDPRGVVAKKLDSVLLETKNKRQAQKEKYGGEMFIATCPATSSGDEAFLDFFQTDKHNGKAKGIISIQLDSHHDHK